MSRFKVGDRVVIVRSSRAHMIGVVATITGYGTSGEFWADELPTGTPLNMLDIPSMIQPGTFVGYPDSHLEPYRDDGQDKSEWTEELRRLCGAKVSA